MKKTIALLISAVLLLLTFSGCAEDSMEYGLSDESEIVSTKFSRPFYDDIEGEPKLSDDQVTAILKKIPYDQYESYPRNPMAPISATLFKDGEEPTIDIRDRRLIRMMNFYHNAVYYSQYSYSQGYLDNERIEEAETESYRLEIKYTPEKLGGTPIFDTIIVTNLSFIPIRYDIPSYNADATAAVHLPLYDQYPWLDLFGF